MRPLPACEDAVHPSIAAASAALSAAARDLPDRGCQERSEKRVHYLSTGDG